MTDIQQEPVRRNRPDDRGKREAPQAAPARETRNGRVEVEGRDGVMLSRKRTGNTDPYAIPPQIVPDGWSYQWNVQAVAGEQAVDSQILMAENGWRPVPAERHAGMFMPEGYKGAILRGGMRLEERPLPLTIEARQEEHFKATNQIRNHNAELGMGSRLGRGSEDRRFLAGGQGVRTSLDAATDVPRPRLEIDGDA